VGVGAATADRGDAVGWVLEAAPAGRTPLHPIRLTAATVTAIVALLMPPSLVRCLRGKEPAAPEDRRSWSGAH